MTWYTVLKIIERNNLNKHNTLVQTSKFASEQIGTTGSLWEGHIFSVWDLLHGLMLPSGNDAAIALAEYFGDFLIKKDNANETSIFLNNITTYSSSTSGESTSKTNKSNLLPEIRSSEKKDKVSDYSFTEQSNIFDKIFNQKSTTSLSQERRSWSATLKTNPFLDKPKSLFSKSPKISRFIKEMNRNAWVLGMTNTKFDSPHGLSNKYNYSTALDIAMLWSVWVGISDFNRIVRCESYVCKARNKSIIGLKTSIAKGYRWNNTNKLLNRGFIGIKTGVTYTAGPCLVTHLKKKKRSYIVVLLNCKSWDQRWIDTWKIIEYCQMKIRWGLINDLKPPKYSKLCVKGIREKPKNLDSGEINLSHLHSTDIALTHNKMNNSFFKSKTEEPSTGCDEDGSTTLSSSSPLGSQRKWLI